MTGPEVARARNNGCRHRPKVPYREHQHPAQKGQGPHDRSRRHPGGRRTAHSRPAGRTSAPVCRAGVVPCTASSRWRPCRALRPMGRGCGGLCRGRHSRPCRVAARAGRTRDTRLLRACGPAGAQDAGIQRRPLLPVFRCAGRSSEPPERRFGTGRHHQPQVLVQGFPAANARPGRPCAVVSDGALSPGAQGAPALQRGMRHAGRGRRDHSRIPGHGQALWRPVWGLEKSAQQAIRKRLRSAAAAAP